MKSYILKTKYNQYVTYRINGKTVYEHRMIMEQHLGRKLLTHEWVHHINENTLDNRLENLRLMSSRCHQQLHHVITSWAKKYDSCIRCGTSENPHIARGFCKKCYEHFYRTGPLQQTRKRKPKTFWSVQYGEKCSQCNSNKFKHQAKGLCSSCYNKNYRRSGSPLATQKGEPG